MKILFGGVTRVTGQSQSAVNAAVDDMKAKKPLVLYSHLSPQDVIVFDGQDTVDFLEKKLSMNLSRDEMDYLKPAYFAKVQQDPNLADEYGLNLAEIQVTAEDAEEQTVEDGDEWKSLSELMEDRYNELKAQGGIALDGTPVLDKKV